MYSPLITPFNFSYTTQAQARAAERSRNFPTPEQALQTGLQLRFTVQGGKDKFRMSSRQTGSWDPRPDCCSVSNNWRLVGAVRKVEFKLLQLGLVVAIEQGHSGRSCFRAIRTRLADRLWRQAGSQVRSAAHKCLPGYVEVRSRNFLRLKQPSSGMTRQSTAKSFPCASAPLTTTS